MIILVIYFIVIIILSIAYIQKKTEDKLINKDSFKEGVVDESD